MLDHLAGDDSLTEKLMGKKDSGSIIQTEST
jgi:hypothetical protein